MRHIKIRHLKNDTTTYFFALLFIVFMVPNIVMGLQKSVSLGGGLSTFSDHYNTGVNVMGTLQLQAYNGISLDINSGYIRANGKDNKPNLRMVPILVGPTFTYKRPFSTLEPYVGLLLGASIMNDSYNSPLLTYGARIGGELKMDGALSIFLNAQYLTLSDSNSKTGLDIEPLSFLMGIKFNLGQDRRGPRVGKQPSRRNQHRRRRLRYQRR
jgi:hypothetical protein